MNSYALKTNKNNNTSWGNPSTPLGKFLCLLVLIDPNLSIHNIQHLFLCSSCGFLKICHVSFLLTLNSTFQKPLVFFYFKKSPWECELCISCPFIVAFSFAVLHTGGLQSASAFHVVCGHAPVLVRWRPCFSASEWSGARKWLLCFRTW